MEGRTSPLTPTLSSGISCYRLASRRFTRSHVPYSNGHLDPWSGGGVLQSVSPSLVAVVIQDGAHHLDLRAADPNDPQDVIDARNKEKDFISQWIKDFMSEL